MNMTHPAGADAQGQPTPFGLTIGPVLYHWSRQALMDFYAEVVETPADTIVIGEVVCARRRELRLPDWLALGADLAAAGKTVVLVTHRTSILALVNRVIVVDGGRIVADGPRDRILEALQAGRIARAA